MPLDFRRSVPVMAGAAGLTLALALAVHAGVPELGARRLESIRVVDADRSLIVSLPIGYGHTNRSYPVLYLLDAAYHIGHVTGTVDFLASRDFAPEMIVVGIESTDRVRDLTPTALDGVPGSGGAAGFLALIRSEIIPWVEDNYRTDDLRILMGHSYGGLFATFALATDPELYNAYVTASPSVYWDGGIVKARLAETLAGDFPGPRILYFSMGGREREQMVSGTRTLDDFLRHEDPGPLAWSYDFQPDHDHDGTQLLSFYKGLLFVFDGWRYPLAEDASNWSLEAVEDYYAKLFDTLGFGGPPPEAAYYRVGFNLLAWGGHEEQALAVFEAAAARHPESPQARKFLGDAYRRTGDPDRANIEYEKARAMIESSGSPEWTGLSRELRELP